MLKAVAMAYIVSRFSWRGYAMDALLSGMIATLAGLGLSYQFDTPSGPTIVCVAALLFVLANLVPLMMSRWALSID